MLALGGGASPGPEMEGGMFEFLRVSPSCFDGIKLIEHGYKIDWLDDRGGEIDFRSDSLRQRAERQAGLLHRAS